MAGQRKNITREVTTSTIKLVKIAVKDGNIESQSLPDLSAPGKVSMEQANRLAKRQYPGDNVAVLEVLEDTKTYTMPIETFLEYASIKED